MIHDWTTFRKSSTHKIAVEYLKNYRATKSKLMARVLTSQKFSGNLYCFWQDKQGWYRENRKKAGL